MKMKRNLKQYFMGASLMAMVCLFGAACGKSDVLKENPNEAVQ